jgi:hypothetical protein
VVDAPDAEGEGDPEGAGVLFAPLEEVGDPLAMSLDTFHK